jgi:Skp family chaperone for outer membrane proteins
MKGLPLMRGSTAAAALAFALVAASVSAQPAAAQTPPAQVPPAQKPPAQAAAPATTPAAPFPEGAKVAYVFIQRILEQSVEGKAATAKIGALQQKKLAELGERNKALEAAQQRVNSPSLSDAARAQAQKEVERLQVEIQRAQQDAQSELDDLRAQLNADFERKLGPIIQQVVTEKDVQVLFSRENAGVVWSDQALDLTSEVIRRFDAAMAKPPAPPKPPQD